MMQEWHDGRAPEAEVLRGNRASWTIKDWAKVFGPCAGEDGDYTFDNDSVKTNSHQVRLPNARARTNVKARRLILEADSNTESSVAALQGRPDSEAGAELNVKTAVREKEVLVEKYLRTLAGSSTLVVKRLARRKEKGKAIMMDKLGKYAGAINVGSYVKLVRNRTQAKVAIAHAVAEKERQLQEAEAKYEVLRRKLTEEVELRRSSEKTFESLWADIEVIRCGVKSKK
ncbi:hypothetical protein AXG93_576s1000 [Marchantia polymorpha subsp. ruderalis]|uniref:Uncharacterized protein n=1 Tax=Marchantia polymorpha subsp. ruderalis TaxID=1480154 RepID=A0A176WG41_MARPO|nr:hypothetical protein AXG93_576s1000 [Marchantia polymorpha subsp. ruderalis]